MTSDRTRNYRLLSLAVWLSLFLAACGTAPATEEERGSFDKAFDSIKLPESEPEDEADREAQKAHYYGASGVAFSQDGKLVAVGSRDMVWVADTSTLETKARLSYEKVGRFGGNKSLLFIDNHRLFVGTDGAIVVWDLQEYTVTDRVRLPGRTYNSRALAWSSATQTLAYSVGAADSTVKLVRYDSSGFGALRDFPMFEGVPADLEFSRDGRYLAAAGDGSGVYIREVATGTEVGVLQTAGYVSELDLFADNQLLVSGSEIVFWTFLNEHEAKRLNNPDLQEQVTAQVVNRAVIGVAGGVAIASLLPLAILGDGAGYGELLAGFIGYFNNNPVRTAPAVWCGRSTTITSNGRLLADVYPGITSEIIRVFDLGTGDLVKELNPRGQNSCSARFSPDGSLLLVTTDKVARLYSTETWRYIDLNLQ